MMAVLGSGDMVGSLSSGCVEADIALHARNVAHNGQPKMLRYGVGSEFMDIKLPCGGGVDVLLVPRPDPEVLKTLLARRAKRRRSVLCVDTETGIVSLETEPRTESATSVLRVEVEPELQFLVFGAGPEASAFAVLVHSLGYPTTLFSPDPETRESAEQTGCRAVELLHGVYPKTMEVDDRSALVLFFHDHDWEPFILANALKTDAFYIGAQGSRGARATRNQALREIGVDAALFDQVRGPIGLISSVRDPRTLAVSVLAEVLDTTKNQGK